MAFKEVLRRFYTEVGWVCVGEKHRGSTEVTGWSFIEIEVDPGMGDLEAKIRGLMGMTLIAVPRSAVQPKRKSRLYASRLVKATG
jgi:hypothetical protein